MRSDLPPAEEPRPRRTLTGALALIVAVAAVGWLVRSPVTNPPPADPVPGVEEPVVEGATTFPTAAPTATQEAAAMTQPLPVGEGTWEEVALPPELQPTVRSAPPGQAATAEDAGDGTIGPQAAAVWHQGALVVLDGDAVSAHDPATRTWRELASFPGQPGSLRAPISTGWGLVVIELVVLELAIGDGTGAPTTAGWWLLGAEGSWRPLPVPPTDEPSGVEPHAGGLVTVGIPRAGGPLGVWALPDPDGTWQALPPTEIPLLSGQPLTTAAGLVLLGAAAGDPVALLWADGAQGWRRLSDPPSGAARSPGVAVPAVGTGATAVDRIVMLGDGEAEGLVLSTYDVLTDRWDDRQIAAPDPDQQVGSSGFNASWDGRGTVWFQSRATALAFALDLPTGGVEVVERPGGVIHHTRPVAFDGGLFVTGGVLLTGERPTPSRRIHRWTPMGPAGPVSAPPHDLPARPAPSGPPAGPSTRSSRGR